MDLLTVPLVIRPYCCADVIVNDYNKCSLYKENSPHMVVIM